MSDDAAETPPQMDTMDTARLEAFSDGVFAVAITLLALEIRVPGVRGGETLTSALLGQWPSYFAYALTFIYILIMWINHHALFRLIRRSDHTLLLFNGLLLMFITLLPFATELLATYIKPPLREPDARTAVIVYNAIGLLIAIMYNLLWRYAAHGWRLLDDRAHPRHVQRINSGYRLGPLFYLVAVGLAFVNIWLSLAVNVALAAFFALPPLGRRPTSSAP